MVNVIKTKRLVLRPFKETDSDDLYEFLSQSKDGEFEGYPDITREAHLRQNVYFRKDENGEPVWKDTYVYVILNNSTRG